MWELIALTIYGFLAFCTFLAIMSDEDVRVSSRLVVIFILMASIWPVTWAVYFLSGKR
jgi:hypothetical protein